jgi:L-rhamnose mutarotase
LERIITELGMERLAFRLNEAINPVVKRVNVQNYSMFRAIMLKGDEWEDTFADSSEEDQEMVREIAARHLMVQLWTWLMQTFHEYEPTKEEMDQIPRETIYIPADIPSIDVISPVDKLI